MNIKSKTLRYCTSLVLLLFCRITSADILTPQEIAQKALDATVLLVMEDASGKVLGVGSGFFVRTNQIATNFHVIEGAERGIAKRVGLETEYKITSFNAIDETHDLAILQVSDASVPALPFGDSDAVVIGDTCYVAGNPKGYLEGTFSHGLISAIRELQSGKLLQLTAPISSGSSGGPVLNNKGEVVGVSVITVTGGQNLNFAVPSNYLNTIISYREGNANYELGLCQLAIENYDTAIRLNPDHVLAYIWRGFAKYELGQHAAASQDCYTARGLKGRIRSQKHIGSRKMNSRQEVNKIAEYDAAIRLNPDNPFVYFWRGFVNNDLAKYDAALADCDTAIRLKPDFALAYSERGVTKSRLGYKIAATQDHGVAIQLRPDYAIFYYNRGVAKRKFGKYDAAIEDFDTAIKLRPNDALVYRNRGVAKHKLGQHTSAISDYDTAIRLQPDYALAYYNRGLAKHKVGRTHKARQDFETALEFAEEFGDVDLKTTIESTLRKLD